MNLWTIVKDSLTLLIAAASAFFALKTYRANARTRRADFLSALHRGFFVEPIYKPMRAMLDDDSPQGEPGRQKLSSEQGDEFTDFLNFFEFVAYLWKSNVLSQQDVEAALGYYLHLLSRSASIRDYIARPKNGFEYLHRLLGKIKQES